MTFPTGGAWAIGFGGIPGIVGGCKLGLDIGGRGW